MISAFIPTLNNERTIRRVIKSLKEQTIYPKRIIVIDSGSTDATEQIVKEEGAEFYTPSYFGFEFLGLGRARNRVLELIDTPYLLSVDSDILLEPDHIEKALEIFDKSEDNLVGVAGKQIELNRIHVGDKCRALVEIKDLQVPIKEQIAEYRTFLMGSNNIYKVDVLKKVGLHFNNNPHRPFEDSLVSNYEDADLGEKLISLGYKLYWTPDLLTYHLQKDDMKGYANRAYRYRVFKWKMKGAFEDDAIYRKRVEHNINYTKMGFDIAFKKSRSFMTYPFLYLGFNSFLEDITIFLDYNNEIFAKKIFNSFKKALNYFTSNVLKQAILEDNHYILGNLNLEETDEIDQEIYDWFVSLAKLDILPSSFPIIHDWRLDSVEKDVQIKAVEHSLYRIRAEENTPIYGGFKVALVNPTWMVDNRYGIRAGSRWPHTHIIKNNSIMPRYIPFPFFLHHTYKMLQDENINSWIIDSVSEGQNEDESFYEVIGYEPNLIVLETSTPSFYIDLDWVRRYKEKLPNTKICIVGTHVSHEKEDLLNLDIIDYVIEGEYEESVLSLVKALKEGKNFFNYIKGVASQYNGFKNPIREFTPFYNFNDRPIPELKYPSLQVQLSRGCPYKCTFCLWPEVLFNKNYQIKKPLIVVEDIKSSIDKYGIKSFYVDDDTFNINKNHIREFAQLLIDNKISLPWMAMARADTIVDEDTLKLLKRSGLIALKFGIESVNSIVLEEMKKNLDVKKCEETISLCKDLEIQVHLTFSIGYFNDTIDTIKETFLWMIKQNPDSMQLSIVTPFPSTAMYNEAKTRGFKLEEDFSKYDGMQFSVVASNIPKQKLEEIKNNWIKEWFNFKETGKYSMEFLEK